MKPSDKLKSLLRQAGYEVPQVFGVLGYWRRVENTDKWQAWGVEIATGQEVHLASSDTMTDCCRHGVTVAAPTAIVLAATSDRTYEVYAK